MKGYATVEEAAKLSGYKPGYIHQLIKAGSLRDVYKVRGRLLVSIAEIRERARPVRRRSRRASAG